MIVLGYEEALLVTCFHEVETAAEMAGRGGGNPPVPRPVYICRKPVEPLATMWPRFKTYR